MPDSYDVVIFGAGGHAKVVVDIVEQARERFCISIVDQDKRRTGESFCGYTIHASLEDVSRDNYKVIVAIGCNIVRKKIYSEILLMDRDFFSAIHISAIISSKATVGSGTVIMPGVIVNADAHVGRHCILNTKCSIDHDCSIEDGVHIAPGATLCGNVVVGEGSFIGAASTILPNLKIGRNVIVGAGTTVRENIADNTKVYVPTNLQVVQQ